jgi:hypothetical protein
MNMHARYCLAMVAALLAGRARAAEVVAQQGTPPDAPPPAAAPPAAAPPALTTPEGSEPSGKMAARSKSPRALNSLVFQPSQLFTGPFTTTSFGVATQLGGGNVDAPRFDLSGTPIGTANYGLGLYGETLDLSVRVLRNVALRLEVEAVLFTGTSSRGILVAGATAQVATSLGATAGYNLTPNTRLAFIFDVGLNPQVSILVGNAVLNAIQDQSFESEGLLENIERVRVTPGVSFAWAPSRIVGFLAEGRYIYARRTGSVEGSAQGASIGGLVLFDLDPLLGWPFAVHGGFLAELPVGGSGISDVRNAVLGFYYTRYAKLALGLEALWRQGRIRPGVEPALNADSGTGTIWFRYYW